ncbi:MAG: hypothetical protein F4081_05720 [Dehalococcoidia bacterium]|nr:hypothetical protein [Dehalococcoidia bacterium]MYI86281.1 hypothetical protein [Dehalococcoidia bacterium]
MTARSAQAIAPEGVPSGWYDGIPLLRRLPVEWQPNPRVFLSMLPVLVFYGLTKVAPAEVAIGGGFAAVTVVFAFTRETPLLRLIAIYGYLITAGSALAGILLTSEKAYLAAGPVGDALILPLYAWTLWRGWPLIGAIGREISPSMVGNLPVNAPIFVKVTLVWAGYEAIKALVLTWMLLNLSIGEYLVYGRLFGWPTTAALVFICGTFILREARRHRTEGEAASDYPSASSSPAAAAS